MMSDKQKLSASERINTLLDDYSFVEIGAEVTARTTDFNVSAADTPKDGVITGYGQINGRLVYVYSQDASVFGGAIGEMHAKKINAIYKLAMKVGAPVIGLIDCAGLRLQEATDALHSFGAIVKNATVASGLIPQVTAVFGNCGGGIAVLAALSDFTFMVDGAKLFINSPNAIKENYVEKCDTSSAEYVSSSTSVVDKVVSSDSEALNRIRTLIDFIPSNNSEFSEGVPQDDLNRTIPDIVKIAEDASKLVNAIADDNLFIETKPDYGKDTVTGLIKLGGATVAVIANNAEKMSSEAADKAAQLVNFADSFNIPVLTFTCIKGFEATFESEKTLARNIANLSAAFANATVPKINVIVGNGFGTGYVVMNSKAVGADIVYAWPQAKIGTTCPKTAAEIIYSEEIDGADDKDAKIKELEKQVADTQASAVAAARRGYVDDIIEPDATRKRLIAAFDMLATKNEDRPYKKHVSF